MCGTNLSKICWEPPPFLYCWLYHFISEGVNNCTYTQTNMHAQNYLFLCTLMFVWMCMWIRKVKKSLQYSDILSDDSIILIINIARKKKIKYQYGVQLKQIFQGFHYKFSYWETIRGNMCGIFMLIFYQIIELTCVIGKLSS